jgi:hypothetical protein
MMDPEVVIPEVVAIGLGYVVAPAILVAMADARSSRSVTCPENGQAATVRLDPKRAVLGFFTDAAPRVCGCSRWPERAGCNRVCEAELVRA